MHLSYRTRLQIIMVVMLSLALLLGCGSSTATETPPVDEPVIQQPENGAPQIEKPPAAVNRVDIVYFHPKVRCAACMSVEIRTQALLEKYYKDALESGMLTFQTYELQDKQNAELVKKYGAVSSQLFINTIVNGSEDIVHVEEVWMPDILNDQIAFEQFMQDLISQKLESIN